MIAIRGRFFLVDNLVYSEEQYLYLRNYIVENPMAIMGKRKKE